MTDGRSQPRRTRALWPVLAVTAVACTGYVGKYDTSSSSSSSSSRANPAPATGAGLGNTATTGPNSGTTGPNGTITGTTVAGESGPRDPGRVTIRRLNRVEYDNTVRDLLGTALTPGLSTFLNDAPQIGFDNDGDQQTLSPVQFALYQTAAESLAAEALTAPAERAMLVTCDLATGTSCAQTIVSNFGQRAFRRPLTADELKTYLALMTTAAQAGAAADEQLQTVLEAILVSPNFLFRPEFDADPASLTAHLLSPYETASRLSYAVYRSMPDQALFDAAAAGKLAQPADLQAQVERMLASPKSAFATTFPAQWLGTGGLPTQTFDAKLFPKFSPALAASMAGEVQSFFSEFLTMNSPVTQLLTANFSYIDSNLAALYGIPAPSGTGLTRTPLTTTQRGGLITMAGVLAVTSYPTRTSLVKRGAWVLGQLLCAPPPAPPPDIPPFPEGAVTATTQKEILKQHRTIPACAACHESMDNIGGAMENYDAVGTYQTQEGGQPIDATGSLIGLVAEPDGKVGPSFNGAHELSAVVAADPRFTACVAQNVLSYALGRAFLPTDQPYVADISKAPSSAQVGVRDILMNVVASDTFRMRRGDPTPATTGGML